MIELHIDTRELVDYAALYESVPLKMANAIVLRALNHVGDIARTQVKRELAKQTGLTVTVVDKSMRTVRAIPARQSYEVVATGKPIALREFAARPTRRGVSARPWGQRRVFPGTFIVRALGGHVFRRAGRGRLPIVKLWGPSLPRELLRGKVPEVFEQVVSERLPERIFHEFEQALHRSW
jgi:Prophage minor tail protein Z (GPZ)